MVKRQELKFDWHVCGQERIIEFLQSAIANNKLNHAYLFAGPSGIGKYTLAKQFIKSIFCLKQDQPVPCGGCSNCQQLERGLHPDVYVIERLIDETTGKWKKDIIIDQIRDLKSRLQQTTLLSGYKAAIIPQAQLINEKAYNSLLKILEEPTAKTVIILLTDNISKIPLTIVSRCQLLNFLPVAGVAMEEYLQSSGIPQQQTKILTHLSHGLPGRAIDLAGQEDILAKLEKNVELFLKIIRTDSFKRLDYLEEAIDWEKDEVQNAIKINQLLDSWQSVLRDFLVLSYGDEYHIANISQLNSLLELKNSLSFVQIKSAVDNIGKAKVFLQQNVNAKSILENLIINL